MELAVTEHISMAKNGDAEAFGRIYETVYEDLYRYACYFFGNREDAADAVQDTALEAFRCIGKLISPESFGPWIFSILIRRCKRILKDRYRRAGESSLELYENSLRQNGPLATDEGIVLQKALSELKSDERTVVVLSVVLGYKSHEVSSILGLPTGTVRSKLSRALDKMAAKMNIT